MFQDSGSYGPGGSGGLGGSCGSGGPGGSCGSGGSGGLDGSCGSGGSGGSGVPGGSCGPGGTIPICTREQIIPTRDIMKDWTCLESFHFRRQGASSLRQLVGTAH